MVGWDRIGNGSSHQRTSNAKNSAKSRQFFGTGLVVDQSTIVNLATSTNLPIFQSTNADTFRTQVAIKNPRRHHDCRALRGARHRRERRHLFDLQPDASAAAAGTRTRPSRKFRLAWSPHRLVIVRAGGELRWGFQLSDVSRSRAGADIVHWHRRAPGFRREHRPWRVIGRRRRYVRLGQLFSGAWPDAGVRASSRAER